MTQKILFVCGHNAGRSQMAQAFFNTLRQSEDIEAISAGTKIGKQVNPICKEAMMEVGISLGNEEVYFPKRMTAEMVKSAIKIISMGCMETCPTLPGGRQFDVDWKLDDPAGQPIDVVRKIRDNVRGHVMNLIKQLKDENPFRDINEAH